MLDGIEEFAHAGVFVILAFFFELLLVAEAIMPNLSRGVGVILIRRDNVNDAVEPFFPFGIYGVTIPAPVHIIHYPGITVLMGEARYDFFAFALNRALCLERDVGAVAENVIIRRILNDAFFFDEGVPLADFQIFKA